MSAWKNGPFCFANKTERYFAEIAMLLFTPSTSTPRGITGTFLQALSSATSALYVSSNGGGHLDPDSSKPPSQPPVKKHVSVTSASLTPPSMTKPLSSNTDVGESSDNLIPSEGNCSTSSISEYLIEMLPGWHVEEFLDSPSSSPLGFSQRDDDSILSFGGCAFGNNSEESLGIWVPQASTSFPSSQHNCPQMGGQHGFKETKEDTNDMRGNRRLATDDAYTVPQISPQSNASNRPFRPFWLL